MRVLRRATVYAIIGVVIVFGVDWIVFAMRRIGSGGMSTVAVDQFVAGALKGNRTEYDYIGTVNQSCTRTLFPQYAASQWNPPCWWLQRHRAHWERV